MCLLRKCEKKICFKETNDFTVFEKQSVQKKNEKYHLCLLALSFFKACQKHCQYRMLFLSSGKSNNRLLIPLSSNLIN